MEKPFIGSVQVLLPEPLKRLVDERVASGASCSAEEFIHDAIREKLAREELTAKLLAGLDSGPALPFDEGFTEKQKLAFLERMKLANKKRA